MRLPARTANRYMRLSGPLDEQAATRWQPGAEPCRPSKYHLRSDYGSGHRMSRCHLARYSGCTAQHLGRQKGYHDRLMWWKKKAKSELFLESTVKVTFASCL